MHFVSSSIYHKATKLAITEGMPADQFQHHQQYAEISDQAKYIPIDLLYDVYEWACLHLSPGFAVRQGMQLNADDYGTLGLAWKTCWSAREILDRLERFMVLVTDHGTAGIRENEGLTTLFIYRDGGRQGVQIANEVSFVMLAGILHEVTGRVIPAVQVNLKHKNGPTLALEACFNCPVHFGSSDYCIQFRSSDLACSTIKADNSIQRFLVDRLNEEKDGIQSSADHLLQDIHRLVTEALPGGIPSVIHIAEQMHMSARTLIRRLSEKQLSFRELVQQIQQETTLNLLKNPGLSIAEIAFQTGFSEQSAFNRAFKRWTNSSPLDYRRNH